MESYRVFVSSPGDTLRERQRVERVVQRLNGEFSGLARLVAVRWESSFYQAHATFQTQIPKADSCDIVVAIFRGRLGTELPPDFEKMANGEPYPSGTAYEVLTAIDKRRHGGELPDVYVFRCPEPPSVKLDDAEGERTTRAQWERLKTFFARFFVAPGGQFKAAFQTFATTDEFEGQLERLLREWLAHKVMRGRSVIWSVAIKGSPFPGLSAYGAEHAPVFFGRSRDVARALEAWREAARRGTPFLLILGASGSGKSSLLRAGLAPRLTTPGVVEAVDLWRSAEMRPGEDSGGPIAALAAALMRKPAESAAEQGRPSALPEIAEGAYQDEAELASLLAHADAAAAKPITEALGRVAARLRSEERLDHEPRCDLVLLVDQLDELFAASIPEEERSCFAKLLGALAATGRIWIAATLRADLYELLLREPSLFALKEQGAAYDLSPPGMAELAEIVRKPAEAAGLVYERDTATGESLDERLLHDADRPDMLPLLQLALARLFEARETAGEEIRLTLSAYEAQGGLSGIIDRAGEEALAKLDPAAIASLPRLLRHLAEPSAEREGPSSLTARDASLAEAAPDDASRRLAAALIETRLLQSRGESGASVIRLAHQRVLSDWARAKSLAAESADFYRIRQEIEARRRAYEASGRRGELLLPRGLPLAQAESMMQRHGDEMSGEARAFVLASRRRANRALWLTGLAACLFALLAAGAGIFAKIAADQRREAQAQRANAERILAAAEGAVHGLTFDIAQGLRDVGGIRVETVRQVLERVRRTIDALGESAPDDPALLRDRAAMLNEFVKTYSAVGDLAAAEKAARESLGLFEDLAKRDAADPRRRRDLMLALNELGVVEDGLGRRAEALALYERGLAMARELAKPPEGGAAAQADLALGLERIAGLRLSAGDRAGARSAYEESIAILRKLVAGDQVEDQWRFGLSDVLEAEAGVLLASDDQQGALNAYEEAAAIMRSLAARDPDNGKWATTLTARLGELGTLRLKMNDVAGARQVLDEALRLSRLLVGRDPDDTRLQRGLAVILSKVADMRLAARERAAAIAAYEEALAIDRGLAARDPGNVDWQRSVTIGLERLGDLKFEGGDYAGARTAFEEMLAVRRALLARDPANVDWRRNLAIALERLAMTDRAMGDAKAALAAMTESVEASRALIALDPGNAEWQLDLATDLTDLGDIRLAADDIEGARAAYEEMIGLGRARLARFPADGDWPRVLSVGLERLGDLLRRSGDLKGATSVVEESLALRRARLARAPGDAGRQRDTMVALNRLGDLRLESKELATALALFGEGLGMARALVAALPNDALAASDLAFALERVGLASSRASDYPTAADAFEEAAALRRRLMGPPPEQASWQALAEDMRQLGNVRFLAGDYRKAAAAYSALAELLRGRVAAQPEDETAGPQLATALGRLAWTLAEMKDAPGEFAARGEGLALNGRLLRLTPSDTERQAALLADLDRVVDLIVASHGDLPKADDGARTAVSAARLLVAGGGDDMARLADIAWRLKQLGDLRLDTGDEAGAYPIYTDAVTLARRVVAAKPGDETSLRGLALILDKIGDLRATQPQAARTASLEQLGLGRQLVALHPGDPTLRVILALILVKVAAQVEDGAPYLAEARALAQALEGQALGPGLQPWMLVLKRFVADPARKE